MKQVNCLIIGAGFGGIGMGYQLRQAEIDSFAILDKATEFGGTWQHNTYPGAECDVPSHLYSYSFSKTPNWSRKWSGQKEILDYIRDCAETFGVIAHLRLGCAVTSASFDPTSEMWIVTTKGNGDETYLCRHVVCSVGQLHFPNRIGIPGMKLFGGTIFHSAEWRHDIDLKDKSVAVIGNAASALQFIPEIAKQARSLTVYQRTANWVMPKGNKTYGESFKSLMRSMPFLQKLYRFRLWAENEFKIFPVMKGSKLHEMLMQNILNRHLEKTISDQKLREALRPKYPPGARRLLVSDSYYQTLNQDKVDLVTEGIDCFTKDGIKTTDGTERPHDVVILGTGFQSNPFLQAIDIKGRDGILLRDVWDDGGARAYLGISVPKFPNLHIIYGPNTNLGHTTVLAMIEAQIGFVIQLIKAADHGTIEVKPEAALRFDDEMQQRLAKSQWARIERSYYKDGERITTNWPGSSFEYFWRTRKPKLAEFTRGSSEG
ncbi:flavin-containing monooxygenase [Ruegeria faecimaris]|uniref:flavin-containing monooxygenase n=1 Tax=Ruegeria faecimaris TaxID=686389 RepID=UPI002491C9ED|nr:NAD(P)/FAD-dependent oxidoreductase [Ruegeria faecimaris]